MPPDPMPFAYLLMGGALVALGYWLAEANRRRLLRARHERPVAAQCPPPAPSWCWAPMKAPRAWSPLVDKEAGRGRSAGPNPDGEVDSQAAGA